MSIYRFSAASIVDEVVVLKTENGGSRAYLHANASADIRRLRGVVDGLREAACEAIPITLDDGKPMLELRHFGSERKLLKMLAEDRVTTGKAQIVPIAKDHIGLLNQLQKRSLQVSGGLYALGDGGFITYGWKEGSKMDVAGGLLYALGTLSLVLFGQNDQADLQVREKAKALEQFLLKDQAAIPETSALHETAKDPKQGMLGQAYDWARSHPSDLFNDIYVGAGTCIAAAALHHKVLRKVTSESAKDRFQRLLSGWADVALGTTTASVSLIGNLVEEKKWDPDDPPPQGWLEKAKAWVQEKPLRVTGIGLMCSTGFHAFSTAVDYIKAKRTNDLKTLSSVPWRGLFVATNMAAEGLIAVSSKGHGEGVTSDDSVKDSVYAMAAEIILRQPPAQREPYTERIVAFLQRPDVMAEGYEAVNTELRRQIGLLAGNPWASTEAPSPTLPAPPASMPPLEQPHERFLPKPRVHINAMDATAPVLAQGA